MTRYIELLEFAVTENSEEYADRLFADLMYLARIDGARFLRVGKREDFAPFTATLRAVPKPRPRRRFTWRWRTRSNMRSIGMSDITRVTGVLILAARGLCLKFGAIF